MFVDRVKILVKGGDGGRGCVSFRREPYVPKGGPDGGTGGHGGDVVLLAVSHQNTLLPLRYHTEFRADRGEHGGPGNRTGDNGGELVVPVPPGNLRPRRGHRGDPGRGVGGGRPPARGQRRAGAAAATGRSSPTATAPRARPSRGGKARSGGCASTCGSSPTWASWAPRTRGSRPCSPASPRRAPRSRTIPSPPSAPVLGVVECDDRTFVLADIPGIIEGAHEGAGLGLQFLRHVEKTRALVHVVDASGTGDDPVARPARGGGGGPRPQSGAPEAAAAGGGHEARCLGGARPPSRAARSGTGPWPRGASRLRGHGRRPARAEARSAPLDRRRPPEVPVAQEHA